MDQVHALLRLSDKDLEVVRVRKQLEELPEKTSILQLRKRVKEIEVLRAKAQAYVDEAARVVHRHEDEIAELECKIEAEQTRITEGKGMSPKEIHDMSRELDALIRRKDKIEMTTMAVMQKLEDGKAQTAQIDDALSKAAAKEQTLIATYQQKGTELQKDIARMDAERAALAAVLKPELLVNYEHACAAKHGIGVGILKGNMCSVCRVELPAGAVSALVTGPEIGKCPNCHRLIITRGVDE